MKFDVNTDANSTFELAGKALGSLREPFRVGDRLARVPFIEFGLPRLEAIDQFSGKGKVIVIDHAADGAGAWIRRRPLAPPGRGWDAKRRFLLDP